MILRHLTRNFTFVSQELNVSAKSVLHMKHPQIIEVCAR